MTAISGTPSYLHNKASAGDTPNIDRNALRNRRLNQIIGSARKDLEEELRGMSPEEEQKALNGMVVLFQSPTMAGVKEQITAQKEVLKGRLSEFLSVVDPGVSPSAPEKQEISQEADRFDPEVFKQFMAENGYSAQITTKLLRAIGTIFYERFPYCTLKEVAQERQSIIWSENMGLKTLKAFDHFLESKGVSKKTD